MSGDYKDWSSPASSWLKEGYFVSYLRDGIRYYEFILSRDLGHYVYLWPETVSANAESGPNVPNDLEITRGYDVRTNTNRIWQVIFGIKGQPLIYVELPTDIHRHGIPKQPKPSTALRMTSHFTELMSPYEEPTFLTEHIMMRPITQYIAFSAYNPNDIDITDLKLNIFIAKLITERVGQEQYGELATPVLAGDERGTAKLKAKWQETLKKLWQRQIPHRPLTLMPVRAPAAAPSGE